MFLGWPWWLWILVFAVAWVIILRRSRNVAIVSEQQDAFGRMPVLVDAKDPKRSIPTKLLASGEYEGAPYEVRWYPGDESVQAFLHVSRIGRTGGTCFIQRHDSVQETPSLLTRAMIRLVRTGDEALDRDLRVQGSRFTSWPAKFLGKPERRAAILRLFEMGCSVIRSDGLGVDALWIPFEGDPAGHAAVTEEALACLAPLVPPHSAARAVPATKAPGGLACGVVVGILGFALALLLIVRWAPVRYPVVITHDGGGLGLLGPALGVGLVVASLLAWRLRRRLSWWILLLLFPLIAILGLGVAVTLLLIGNGALDRGPAVVRVRQVLEFNRRSDQRGEADVEPWRKSQNLYTIPVDADVGRRICEALEREDELGPAYLEITTKPGFFGWEWIQQVKVKSGNKVETQGSTVLHTLPGT